VLAEPLRATAPVPAYAVALRAGWAVAAADVVGASPYAPVQLAKAGRVKAGQALPAGMDAVVPPDAATSRTGFWEIVAETAPGEGVRRAGEDAAAGVILRAAGEQMRPNDIAVAHALGISHLLVRQARVRILSLPAAAGVDAAADLVSRVAEAAGVSVEQISLTSGDTAAIAASLAEPGSNLSVVVGTGSGRNDPGHEALAAAGSVITGGIALRPGESSGCGFVGAVPVILAPGRLEGALAATLTLIVPCIDYLTGASARLPPLSGPLTRKVSSVVGMTDLVLLRRRAESLEPVAVGDLTLAAIAGADAWLAVPPDSEGFAAGETVRAFLL
jgi:molybdopterin molybdotransferase